MKTRDLSRRTFLMSLGIGLCAARVHAAPAARKRVALLATEVREFSHAQHFIDRLAMGYAWAGSWRKPEVDLVSLYVDQFPDNDLARSRAKRHGIPIYPTVADALTMGNSKLAVDGVVIIAEHGQYPVNEKGQTLYPRYKFFKESVKVFEDSGRSAAVFNDKHLSTEWAECAEMLADARRLDFPFLAGSSLPVTRRLPAIDVPHGVPLGESVCVAYGEPDSYDFHGLETAQCMSERRRGGELGIRSVHAVRDARMWDRLAGRETTQRLFLAALSRSHNLPAVDGYLSDPISLDWAQQVFPEGYAYFIEHRDGFQTTLFMLPIRDFNYAGLNSETGEVYSCQMYLPMPGQSATTADFFHPLVHHIERLVVENRAPYPAERTLLTSGMTLAGVESLHRGQQLVETPEMEVQYTVPDESLFWRT
jgi:hypothetical protein